MCSDQTDRALGVLQRCPPERLAALDPGLRGALRSERGKDGEPIYSLPTVLSLLVFYVFACQCVSTLAVCRRETASWRWPLFMLAYMTVLAWVSAFITYRVALALSGS